MRTHASAAVVAAVAFVPLLAACSAEDGLESAWEACSDPRAQVIAAGGTATLEVGTISGVDPTMASASTRSNFTECIADQLGLDDIEHTDAGEVATSVNGDYQWTGSISSIGEVFSFSRL